jgi:hypothetical protein
MKVINLDLLKEGISVISKKTGAFLAEAAAICFALNGYESGVQLNVKGVIEGNLKSCGKMKSQMKY